MSETVTIKEEVHDLVESLSDHALYALRPLLKVLLDELDDTLSDEELTLFLECEKDIHEHPEKCTPWEKARRTQPKQ